MKFVFKPQIISNHRNKLAIRGLSTIILNGISKIGVEGIHIPSIPRDLDGVADGALDAAGGVRSHEESIRFFLYHRSIKASHKAEAQPNRRPKDGERWTLAPEAADVGHGYRREEWH